MELTLTCELITPMFMTGADRETPELRPSEFKGMIRWWWRAIKAESDIRKLREKESKIFGGAGEGEGKSRVRVFIESELEPSDIVKEQPLPHHSGGTSCPYHEGERSSTRKVKCRKAFELSAVRAGKQIKIKFTIPDLAGDIESLIYLVFILGGFGKRSRRGFGSFEIIDPSVSIDLKKITELLNLINNSYEISKDPDLDMEIVINKQNSGGNYPWVRKIIIGRQSFDNYSLILRKIGKVSHRYSDPSLGSIDPRMASPVYVSVIRVNNQLKPIITVLNSSFPEDYHYDIEKQQQFIRELAL